MRKRFKKLLCLFACAVMLVSFAFSADAQSFYTNGDCKFEQGISSVDCYNGIDGTKYTYISAAVEYAIVDWDWHLGLLNEQYGVNWNLVDFNGDITQEVAMIEFRVMTASEYADETNFNFADKTVAHTILYGASSGRERNSVMGYDIDWSSAVITFLSDQLYDYGQLEDVYALKAIANHEIGHALGLEHHPYDKGVIMYPNDGRTAFVPTAADLEGIYYLYGQ